MQSSDGWVPVYADATQRLSVMSIAFLLKNTEEAVVWRGPKKNAMIKQFLEDVLWGPLDFLIIDTPPGTSDEQASIILFRLVHPCSAAHSAAPLASVDQPCNPIAPPHHHTHTPATAPPFTI